MCLDRPSRKVMPHDRVLFDPEITGALVELLLKEQLEKQRSAT